MELFLVRHGIAVDHGARGSDDARWLTKQGIDEFRRVVKGLEALGIGFDAIVHSPLRRAAETAELLVPLLEGFSRVDPALAARADSLDLAAITGERVALVGHEPYMGQLAALLVVGEMRAASRFRFAKGGVLWLEGERPASGRMELVAMLPPRVLISSDRS